jgi:hypothetical protein
MATQSSLLIFDTSIIRVSFSRPSTFLRLDGYTEFGELNERIAQVLVNIGSEEGISFEIYCRTINRRAAPAKKGRRKTGTNELQYVMNAIIYGPDEICDATGEYLAKCGVYLQDPLHCDRDVVYSNPQMLPWTQEIVMTSTLACPSATPEIEKVASGEDLFSELSTDDHLSLTEAPDAVLTPLYA